MKHMSIILYVCMFVCLSVRMYCIVLYCICIALLCCIVLVLYCIVSYCIVCIRLWVVYIYGLYIQGVRLMQYELHMPHVFWLPNWVNKCNKMPQLSEEQRLTWSKKFNGSTKFCIDWSQKNVSGQRYVLIWSDIRSNLVRTELDLVNTMAGVVPSNFW